MYLGNPLPSLAPVSLNDNRPVLLIAFKGAILNWKNYLISGGSKVYGNALRVDLHLIVTRQHEHESHLA